MKTKNLVKLAQVVFYLNAVIWAVMGIASLVRMPDSGEISKITMVMIAILMFGNAVAMLVCGLGLGTRLR